MSVQASGMPWQFFYSLKHFRNFSNVKADRLSVPRFFRLLLKEVLVFLLIFSGWLLYALLADIWFQPIELPADLIFMKMAYISLQTYFVVAMIRFTHRMIARGGREDEE